MNSFRVRRSTGVLIEFRMEKLLRKRLKSLSQSISEKGHEDSVKKYTRKIIKH